VEDFLAVDEVDGSEDAPDEETRLVLSESMSAADAVSEVSAREQIHDEVEIISVVECGDHVGDEGGVESLEDLALVEHVFY
jgi:hypothetical protein